MIHVCSLARLHETVERTGARHVISLINGGTVFTRPSNVDPTNHLFLGLNDIVEEMEGLVAPAEHHMHELLDFVRAWPREAPLVIHCYAGISRSTAAAYATLCAWCVPSPRSDGAGTPTKANLFRFRLAEPSGPHRLGKLVHAIRAQRQRHHLEHGRQRQGAVKVRKQVAAARGLPAQGGAETGGIHGHQQQIPLSGEMPARGLTRLRGGGKMNVAIRKIDRRAVEPAFGLCLYPKRRRYNLEDGRGRCHTCLHQAGTVPCRVGASASVG